MAQQIDQTMAAGKALTGSVYLSLHYGNLIEAKIGRQAEACRERFRAVRFVHKVQLS